VSCKQYRAPPGTRRGPPAFASFVTQLLLHAMVLLHCVFVRVIARGKGHYGPVRAIALGETA